MRAMIRPLRLLPILCIPLALTACQRGDKQDDHSSQDQPSTTRTESTPPEESKPQESANPPENSEPVDDIESKDILARTEVADRVDVKHVLIGWKDLSAAYRGHMDPRAKERTQAEAAELATKVADELRKDPDAIDRLVKKHSEDPGSLRGTPYTVTAKSRFVPSFKKMALRLKEKEVGIVRSDYGYHVMERVPPPPPDPLESADILARDPVTDHAKVKHILLGWTEANTGDPRGAKRSRADLEKLVKKTVASLRKGTAIEPLMAKLSEDPGSAKSGKSYDASPDAHLVPPFKALSLRLKKDEVGVVKTRFGIHIIKRVE